MRVWEPAGRWAPVVACMAGIWLLSSRVSPPGAGLLPDKLGHALLYAVFGLVTLRATHGGVRPARVAASTAALLLTVGWGAVDEWHQSFVAGRHASLADVAADAAGALAALAAFAFLAARRARRTRRNGPPAG